jgi:stage V sporulation protein S
VIIFKVSSSSNPNSLAGAIAGSIKEVNVAEIQVIGAGALNQAIKAVAIARGFVAPGGIDLVCTPSFRMVEVDGNERTAIRLLIDPRRRSEI